MTEGNTIRSDTDAPIDNHAENSGESKFDHDHSDPSSNDAIDTSTMTRALKHELEQKGMTVEIEDDGETVSAEKLDQLYRIHPDGTVEGNGVLTDGIEDIVDDLGTDHGTGVEDSKVDSESGTELDSNNSDTYSGDSGEKDGTDGSSQTPKTLSKSDDEHHVKEKTDEAGNTEVESLPTGNVGQFEAAIEANRLQQVIEAAHAVVDECRVHLDTDGLIIRAVDPANVAMVDEHVSADAFETYDTDCGEVGIDLDRLSEVVGIADSGDDLVQFDLDAKTRKIDVQVNTIEYTLALIDPEAIRMEPDIPDLDLSASFSIGQDDFKRAIRAADMVSDHVWFRVDADEACFIAGAEGDTDDVELEVDGDDLENADLHEADSLFSLDYLKDLRKPIPKDTAVDVQLGKEFPVVLGFELADGAIDITYMLAPRIQGD